MSMIPPNNIQIPKNTHKLIAICAMGLNREIGKNNDLCFRSKEDMQMFKNVTTGGLVVMGRKTFESLPKPLENRINVVVTNDNKLLAEGSRTVGSTQIFFKKSVDSVLKMVEEYREREIQSFVIGGASIYELFAEHTDALLLSCFDREDEEADTFFPKIEYPMRRKESFVFEDYVLEHYVG